MLQLLPCMAHFLVVDGTGCTLSRGEQWLDTEVKDPLFWLHPVGLLGWRGELGGRALLTLGQLKFIDMEKAAWLRFNQLSVGVQLCQIIWGSFHCLFSSRIASCFLLHCQCVIFLEQHLAALSLLHLYLGTVCGV